MSVRRSSLAAFALLAALSAALAVQTHRLSTSQQHAGALALRNDSAAAAVDTTHDVRLENPRVAELLGDSLHLVQRRVVQAKQRSDSIDRALGLERIARQDVAVRLDSLQRIVASRSSVTEDTASHVRRAQFNVRQAPYTLAAAVELPAAPDTGRLDVRIALDEIPIVARLSCAAPNPDGIRSASIEATSPAWASVRFDHVEQSPDLCRSPALQTSARGVRVRPAIVVGVGLIASSTSQLQLGGFAGVGFAIGR